MTLQKRQNYGDGKELRVASSEQGGRDEMNVERAWVTLALETGGVYFTQTGREGHLGRVRCLALGSLPPPLPRASLASSVPL